MRARRDVSRWAASDALMVWPIKRFAARCLPSSKFFSGQRRFFLLRWGIRDRSLMPERLEYVLRAHTVGSLQ